MKLLNSVLKITLTIHVILATGSHWRNDGIGRNHRETIPGLEKVDVFTPDDIMNDISVKDELLFLMMIITT